MKRSTLLTLLAAARSARSCCTRRSTSQQVECTVTIEFNGRTNSATASGANEPRRPSRRRRRRADRSRSGMNESIACGNVVPVKKACRTL